MHPHDLDPVATLVVRLVLVPVEPARDHRHVVIGRERLAQLGEQVRRRLDAGPVVLVEDEQPRTAGRGHRRVRILTAVPRYARARMAGSRLHRLRTAPATVRAAPIPSLATRLAGRVVALRARRQTRSPARVAAWHLKRFVAYPSLYCPRCGSYERHRLLALHLDRRPDLLAPPLALLQVSPDRPLERLLDATGIDRISIDIDNPTVDLEMDVQRALVP